MRLYSMIVLSCLWMSSLFGQTPQSVESKPVQPKPDDPPVIHTEIEVRTTAPLVEGNYLTPGLVTFSRVTREQLDDRPTADILTGLHQVPGVLVSRYNMVGSYGGADGGTIYIRGLGGSRPGGEILFQVDGAPVYSGVWAHPLMDLLSADTTEEIDVIKGASPVLHGNMAFGVVDIRTRRLSEPGREFGLMAAGGSHESLALAVHAGWRGGRWDTYLVASFRHSDGHRDHSGGELQSYFGRLGAELAPGWRLGVTFSHTGNYAEDPGSVATGPPLQGQFNTDDWTTVVTLENTGARFDGFVRFYLNDGAIRWQQWSGAQNVQDDGNTDYRNWGIRLRQRWQADDRLVVIAGLDWDVYGGSYTRVLDEASLLKEPLTFWNIGPYVQILGRFGGRTVIEPTAGLRWNSSRYFGSQLAPEAGLSLRRGTTRVHLSGSHAFNLPGVYAAFNYQDWNQGQSWRDLEAERLWHVEAGVSSEPAAFLRLDATLFHDHGTGALRFSAPPPHFDNIGTYTTQGVECTGNLFPDPSWHMFAGYTFLRQIPDDLPNAPGHTASFGANWQVTPRFRAGVDGQYVSSRWVGNTRYPGRSLLDGYFLLNGQIQFDVAPDTWNERVVLFAELDNLTSTEYEYRPGYPMPGITLWTGVRVTLKK